MTSALAKRLPKEMKLTQDAGISIELVDEHFAHWHVTVHGPAGTPYEGGEFLLDVRFPDAYPHAPPQLRFLTPVLSPNVDHEGKLCDRLFDHWQPNLTIRNALDIVAVCFTDYHAGVVNTHAAQLVDTDLASFEAQVRKHTKEHATPNTTASAPHKRPS